MSKVKNVHPDLGDLLGFDAPVQWCGDYYIAHLHHEGRGFHGRGRTIQEARTGAGRLAAAVMGYQHPEPHFYAEPKAPKSRGFDG